MTSGTFTRGRVKKPMKKSSEVVEPEQKVSKNILDSLKRVHMRVKKY